MTKVIFPCKVSVRPVVSVHNPGEAVLKVFPS